MKHGHDLELPSHAGDIPEEGQVTYDYGLQSKIDELPVPVEQVPIGETPISSRSKLSKGMLRRVTASTLATTTILGSAFGAHEVTAQMMAGRPTIEIQKDQDFQRMADTIVHGFEKARGGACEIVGVEDQHGLPQDVRPELQGRTAVKVILHMKYSPEAQRARDENDNLRLSGDHLDEAEPKLGAYTVSSDNSRVAIWLGQGSESNPAYSGVGLMTHAPITPTHEKDGGASYYVDQTLYLPDAANKPPVSSVNFQVTTSVKLMTTNSATEIARSTADCDGKLEVRDGSWQLAK